MESIRECSRINPRLLYLKIAYFLFFSTRIACLPYVNLISTKIVTYEQLAISFAFIPASSIVGPIIIGFLADKTGSYKLIMILTILVGVGVNSAILGLQAAALVSREELRVRLNFSDSAHLSWNGSHLQFDDPELIHSTGSNLSVWLHVDSCHFANETTQCSRAMNHSLDTMRLFKSKANQPDWDVQSGPFADPIEGCSQVNCTVSIENSTWTAKVVGHSGKNYIFPLLLLIRVLAFVTVDSTSPLMDATAVYMTKLHGGDFARQKMWAYWSFVIIPITCGSLIDLVEQYAGYKEYGLVFGISGLAAITIIPLILKLDFHVPKNRESMLQTAKMVCANLDVNVFLLVEMIVGMCWGFHINYIAVYLDTELDASKTFLGLALSANGVGAMVVLAIGTLIVNRLGQAYSVVLSLLCYCARFTSFYFLKNVWIVLVLEVLEGFCGFIGYLAGTYFCASTAPPGMMASLTGILSAAFYGAGRGLGTSVGSALIAQFGVRMTYLVLGLVAGAASIVYLIAYQLWLKNYERKRLESKDAKMALGVSNPVFVSPRDSQFE